MRKHLYLFVPLVVFAVSLSATLCQGEVTIQTTKGDRSLDITKPQYTFLKDCKDITHHDNAAFTKLSCAPIGEYKVNITEQSPQYFNIHLTKGAYSVSSDFTTVSNQNPVEAGKAIEWHFVENKPKYMIFRLSWGTAEKPFKMRQYLVVNMVTDKDICTIATVDVKNNKNANQKARDLILKKFLKTTACPRIIEAF